jgi:hypothetical protein
MTEGAGQTGTPLGVCDLECYKSAGSFKSLLGESASATPCPPFMLLIIVIRNKSLSTFENGCIGCFT